MKYDITFDEDNYILTMTTNDNGKYEVSDDFQYGYIECYHLVGNSLVLDEVKKQKRIEEEQKEIDKPTWQNIIDSQVFYTAMMTDTLIEEE